MSIYTTITKVISVILILYYLLPTYMALFISALGIFIVLRYTERLRKRVNYYLAYSFIIAYSYVVCALSVPILAFRPRNPKNMRLLAYYAIFVAKVVQMKWHIRNQQNMVPNSEAGIIVSNHQSFLDAMGLMILTQRLKIQYTVIARNLLFCLWPVGLTMWLSGILFVNRTPRNQNTYVQMYRAGHYIKKQNMKLWIFPEGTRNKDPKNLLPFKKGAFHLAIQTQLPIIPIVFSPYYFIDHNERFYEFGGKMIMNILPPIKTKGLTLDDLDALIQKTTSIMSAKNMELRKEFKMQ